MGRNFSPESMLPLASHTMAFCMTKRAGGELLLLLAKPPINITEGFEGKRNYGTYLSEK